MVNSQKILVNILGLIKEIINGHFVKNSLKNDFFLFSDLDEAFILKQKKAFQLDIIIWINKVTGKKCPTFIGANVIIYVLKLGSLSI